jgi:hypothetical protein
MVDDSSGTSEPSDRARLELVQEDLALRQIVPGDLLEDQRRRDALRGLAMAAEEWSRIADLLPNLRLIQSFTASVLDQAIKGLPQLEKFQVSTAMRKSVLAAG